MEYYYKEHQMKIDKLNGYLGEKTREYEQILREYEQNKKLLKEC